MIEFTLALLGRGRPKCTRTRSLFSFIFPTPASPPFCPPPTTIFSQICRLLRHSLRPSLGPKAGTVDDSSHRTKNLHRSLRLLGRGPIRHGSARGQAKQEERRRMPEVQACVLASRCFSEVEQEHGKRIHLFVHPRDFENLRGARHACEQVRSRPRGKKAPFPEKKERGRACTEPLSSPHATNVPW